MRRALVLTDERARHPFLASLPPHVRAGVKPVEPRPRLRITLADVRGFASAYVACLVGVGIFIA